MGGSSDPGCPYCSGRKVLAGFSDLATTHPGIAAMWHPRMNRRLKPTGVQAISRKPAWWRGECGHVYQMAVRDRARAKPGYCPYCSGRKRQISSPSSSRWLKEFTRLILVQSGVSKLGPNHLQDVVGLVENVRPCIDEAFWPCDIRVIEARFHDEQIAALFDTSACLYKGAAFVGGLDYDRRV